MICASVACPLVSVFMGLRKHWESLIEGINDVIDYDILALTVAL